MVFIPYPPDSIGRKWFRKIRFKTQIQESLLNRRKQAHPALKTVADGYASKQFRNVLTRGKIEHNFAKKKPWLKIRGCWLGR